MDEIQHHFEAMGNHLFVSIDGGIIILGLLRWCEMDFVLPRYVHTHTHTPTRTRARAHARTSPQVSELGPGNHGHRNSKGGQRNPIESFFVNLWAFCLGILRMVSVEWHPCGFPLNRPDRQLLFFPYTLPYFTPNTSNSD